VRIVIELTEQGERWIREWPASPEHQECRDLCGGSYAEYIRRTGMVFNPLGAQFGIREVRLED